ncbi:phage tail protein [Psychrobacter sp. FDAARGOS_221]|uniref:phage tail protein n=1 Tax=Psychrobacter sp. FDAARGOS_221 TaxID=1975705 RepID=UPI000BB579D7|nr:phage tail protein [Psychrobacter sp. FDAARGOS_221]PNK59472.1 phage tail protein [Psychrobacter sp. FDAARGOS_221]PNK61460.1 phage tail protein [Psychrobacter sp. FDAARGOS_221]
MKTFTYDIGIQAAGSTDNDVVIVQFGDGYAQRQPKGLAPRLEHWQASKVGNKATIDEIKAFLDAHTVTPFLWRVTSDEPLRKYIAKDISRSPQGGSKWTLNWTMQQVLA